jgi:signal transduction histidine kinase
VTSRPSVVVIICGDVALTERVVQEISLIDSETHTPHSATLAQALAILERQRPVVIFIDQSSLGADVSALDELFAPFTEVAPVIFAGDPAFQESLTVLIGSGAVDMVARVGNFAPIAVGLIERRLQQAELAELGMLQSDGGDNFAETLRHEVNNPLTGILGNAQLLLSRARREGQPPRTVERLQTIAELAMRLRETVRVLSQNWEDSERSHLKARASSAVNS